METSRQVGGDALDAAPPGVPLSVLVVENHSDTRQGVQIFLRALGYQASGAENMTKALALADRMRFDVLLSDISLPDGDGWELLAQLEARDRRPAHAIAMSGLGSTMDRARSQHAGFEVHLVKPFAPEDLQEALRRAADRRAAADVPVGGPGPVPGPTEDRGTGADWDQRMHDGLCQQLAAAALLQGALVRRLEKLEDVPAAAISSEPVLHPGSSIVEDARYIGDLLDDALTETRTLMRAMRSGDVEPANAAL